MATTPSSICRPAPSTSPTAASRAAIAPGPIDAFAYTDRGVYRAGEQVHLTALARDRTGKASGLPITVIFSRPDGVEHSRIDAHRPGPGRPQHDAGARRLGHDRHLARQDPHRSEVRRHRPGLVPGRGLRARAPRPQARAGRAGAVPAGARHHQARRPLSLRPARRRPRHRGRDRREARQGRSAGLRRLQVRPRRRAGGARAQAARRAARHRRGRQGRHRRAAARPAEDQPAAGGGRDPEAQGIRRAHHRAHRHAAGRPQVAAHRHPAAVQGRTVRGRRAGALRGHRGRRRRQGRRRQGPQVGADAAREPLAVVQPRRLVELRVADQLAPRRHRHGRCRRRHAGQDRSQGRLGPLSPGGEHRRRHRPDHLQHGVQRRLLRRRGRRQPRGARRRPRQAVLQGGRDGARQDRLAHGRPRAHRRDELGPRQHAGGRSAGRRRRGADPRQRRLEPRRLRHRHALPADGREGQAHALARARPALARHRPGAAHAQRAPRRAREGEVRVRR